MVFTSENDLDLGASSVTDGKNKALNLVCLVLPHHWPSLHLDFIHVGIFRGVVFHPVGHLLKLLESYSHLKLKTTYLLYVLLVPSGAPQESDDENHHCYKKNCEYGDLKHGNNKKSCKCLQTLSARSLSANMKSKLIVFGSGK